MKRQLRMTSIHWAQMRKHVVSCAPLEGCGLLGGKGDVVERVMPVENTLRSPDRFRMEPQAQLRAFDELDANNLALLGIFHSHTGGALPIPSATDVREAVYEVVHVIWAGSGSTWLARGFWIAGGRITEIRLRVENAQ